MSLLRLDRRIRRATGLVIACVFAFVGIAHAAKACPLGARDCLPQPIVAMAAAGEHHADQPCAMKMEDAERSGTATAPADTPGPAAPVVAALLVAMPVTAAPPAPSGRFAASRHILDAYGRLRL